MKKVNEVFFGNHGLTSTSANHLANIAKEKIVSNEAKLKNLNFVTTTVDIVGSPADSGKTITDLAYWSNGHIQCPQPQRSPCPLWDWGRQ